MDRGYFAAEGLEVNLVPVKSISDEVTMLVTGGADLGASAPDVSLFNAIAGGVDIRMLASGGVFLPGTRASGLVVRQDLIDQGMYRGPADFRGRRIGVSSVQGQFYAEQILARAGLSASDVNVTTIAALQLLAALQGHAVDAAWLVLATGRVNEVTATHFMRAYLQGLRNLYHAFWLKDADPGPLPDSLAAHGPVHDRQILDGVAVHSVDPNGGIDVSSLNHYQDYYIATGNQTDAIDMDQHIDLGPLESALASLGRL